MELLEFGRSWNVRLGCLCGLYVDQVSKALISRDLSEITVYFLQISKALATANGFQCGDEPAHRSICLRHAFCFGSEWLETWRIIVCYCTSFILCTTKLSIASLSPEFRELQICCWENFKFIRSSKEVFCHLF